MLKGHYRYCRTCRVRGMPAVPLCLVCVFVCHAGHAFSPVQQAPSSSAASPASPPDGIVCGCSTLKGPEAPRCRCTAFEHVTSALLVQTNRLERPLLPVLDLQAPGAVALESVVSDLAGGSRATVARLRDASPILSRFRSEAAKVHALQTKLTLGMYLRRPVSEEAASPPPPSPPEDPPASFALQLLFDFMSHALQERSFSPSFWKALQSACESVSARPFSIELSGDSQLVIDKIAGICHDACEQLFLQHAQPTHSLVHDGPTAESIASMLIGTHLSMGGIEHSLRAALFALNFALDFTQPLHVGPVLRDWETSFIARRKHVLRLDSSEHLSEVRTAALTTALDVAISALSHCPVVKTPPTAEQPEPDAHAAPPPEAQWQFLCLSGWESFPHDVHVRIEDAFQQRRSHADFTLNGTRMRFNVVGMYETHFSSKLRRRIRRVVSDSASADPPPMRLYPRSATSSCGRFIYLLSTQRGLVKVGTGFGRTVIGKVYAQNIHMSVHAAGYLAALPRAIKRTAPELDQRTHVDASLLLRSPLLPAHTLLVINPETLLFSGERVLVPAPELAPPNWVGGDSTGLTERYAEDAQDFYETPQSPWCLQVEIACPPINREHAAAQGISVSQVPRDMPRALPAGVPSPVPPQEASKGHFVDALDDQGFWHIAKVVRCTEHSLFVQFNGWARSWNTWRSRTGALLAPLGHYTLVHKQVPGLGDGAAFAEFSNWPTYNTAEPVHVPSPHEQKQASKSSGTRAHKWRTVSLRPRVRQALTHLFTRNWHHGAVVPIKQDAKALTIESNGIFLRCQAQHAGVTVLRARLLVASAHCEALPLFADEARLYLMNKQRGTGRVLFDTYRLPTLPMQSVRVPSLVLDATSAASSKHELSKRARSEQRRRLFLEADPVKLKTLTEMGVSRVRAEKALVHTSNVSLPAAFDWILTHHSDPDLDVPLAELRARVAAESTADADLSDDEDETPGFDVPMQVCHQFVHRTPLPISVHSVDTRPQLRSVFSWARTLSPSLSPRYVCLGCGVACEHGSTSTTELYVCTHRACQSVVLCRLCHVTCARGQSSAWRSTAARLSHHHAGHRMEPIALPTDSPAFEEMLVVDFTQHAWFFNASHALLTRIPLVPRSSEPMRAQQWNIRAGGSPQLASNPSVRLPPISTAFDVSGTVAKISDVKILTRAETFSHDPVNGVVWALSEVRSSIERWHCSHWRQPPRWVRVPPTSAGLVSDSLAMPGLPTPPDTGVLRPSAGPLDDLSSVVVARRILAQLDCYAHPLLAPKHVLTGLSLAFQATKHALRVFEARFEASQRAAKYANVMISALQLLRAFVLQVAHHPNAMLGDEAEQLRELLAELRSFLEGTRAKLETAPSRLPGSYPFDPDVLWLTCCIQVDALELLYPTWSQRLRLVADAMHASPPPELFLHAVRIKYRQCFSGLRPIGQVALQDVDLLSWNFSASSPDPAAAASAASDGGVPSKDEFVLSSETQELVHNMLNSLYRYDSGTLSDGQQLEHPVTYFLLCFFSQLHFLVLSRHHPPDILDDASAAFATLSSHILTHGMQLLDPVTFGSDKKLWSSADSTVLLQPRPATVSRAPSPKSPLPTFASREWGLVAPQGTATPSSTTDTLAGVPGSAYNSSTQLERHCAASSIFVLLPWACLWLPHVDMKRLSSADASNIVLSTAQLLARLDQAVSTDVVLDNSATDDQSTPPLLAERMQVADGIAQLCELRHLVVEPHAQSHKFQLLPLARSIFTAIFNEFARPRSWRGRPRPVLTLDKRDFRAYLIAVRRDARSDEDVDAVFRRYCKAGALEPKYLTLRRFLSMYRDMCMDEKLSVQVIRELQTLHDTYDFHQPRSSHGTVLSISSTQQLSMLRHYLEYAFSTVAHHVFTPHTGLKLRCEAAMSKAGHEDTVFLLMEGHTAWKLDPRRAHNTAFLDRFIAADAVSLTSPELASRPLHVSHALPKSPASAPGVDGVPAQTMTPLRVSRKTISRSRKKTTTRVRLSRNNSRASTLPRHSDDSGRSSRRTVVLAKARKKRSASPPASHKRSVSSEVDSERVRLQVTVDQEDDPAISTAATRFASFFSHCLNELGRGTGFDLSFTRRVERMFAAVLIKHNQLIARCMDFARSKQLALLIARAGQKGVRCMFHPDTPAWFKTLVQTTFRTIRAPFLTKLRRRHDGEDGAAESAVELKRTAQLWTANARFLLADVPIRSKSVFESQLLRQTSMDWAQSRSPRLDEVSPVPSPLFNRSYSAPHAVSPDPAAIPLADDELSTSPKPSESSVSLRTDWLVALVQSPEPLASSGLRDAVEHLSHTSDLRVRVLQLLTQAFTRPASGNTREDVWPVVDRLLPPLWGQISTTPSAHLLNRLQASARAPSTIQALTQFLTELGRLMLDTVSESSVRVLRLRLLLQFCTARFQKGDTAVLLEAGILATLAQLNHKLGLVQRFQRARIAALQPPTVLSPNHKPRQFKQDYRAWASKVALARGELTDACRCRRWVWYVFSYLAMFCLDDAEDNSPQLQTLASSVGHYLFEVLRLNLHLLLRLPRVWVMGVATTGSQRATSFEAQPASGTESSPRGRSPKHYSASEANELVFQCVDMLRLLQRISCAHSVCSPRDLVFLVDMLSTSMRMPRMHERVRSLPSLVEIEIVRLLGRELRWHKPDAFPDYDLPEQLLSCLGSALFESQVLNKQQVVENELARLEQEKEQSDFEAEMERREVEIRHALAPTSGDEDEAKEAEDAEERDTMCMQLPTQAEQDAAASSEEPRVAEWACQAWDHTSESRARLAVNLKVAVQDLAGLEAWRDVVLSLVAKQVLLLPRVADALTVASIQHSRSTSPRRTESSCWYERITAQHAELQELTRQHRFSLPSGASSDVLKVGSGSPPVNKDTAALQPEPSGPSLLDPLRLQQPWMTMDDRPVSSSQSESSHLHMLTNDPPFLDTIDTDSEGFSSVSEEPEQGHLDMSGVSQGSRAARDRESSIIQVLERRLADSDFPGLASSLPLVLAGLHVLGGAPPRLGVGARVQVRSVPVGSQSSLLNTHVLAAPSGHVDPDCDPLDAPPLYGTLVAFDPLLPYAKVRFDGGREVAEVPVQHLRLASHQQLCNVQLRDLETTAPVTAPSKEDSPEPSTSPQPVVPEPAAPSSSSPGYRLRELLLRMLPQSSRPEPEVGMAEPSLSPMHSSPSSSSSSDDEDALGLHRPPARAPAVDSSSAPHSGTTRRNSAGSEEDSPLLSSLLACIELEAPDSDDVYKLLLTRVQTCAMRVLQEHLTGNESEEDLVACLPTLLAICHSSAPRVVLSGSDLSDGIAVIEEILQASACHHPTEQSSVKDGATECALHLVCPDSFAEEAFASAQPPTLRRTEVAESRDAEPHVAGGDDAAAPVLEEDLRGPPLILTHLTTLTRMGYDPNVAKMALCLAGGDVNEAMNFILSGALTYLSRDQGRINREWQQLMDQLQLHRSVHHWLAEHPDDPNSAAAASAVDDIMDALASGQDMIPGLEVEIDAGDVDAEVVSSPASVPPRLDSVGGTPLTDVYMGMGEFVDSAGCMSTRCETEPLKAEDVRVGMPVLISAESAAMFVWSHSMAVDEVPQAPFVGACAGGPGPTPVFSQQDPGVGMAKEGPGEDEEAGIKAGYVVRLYDTYNLLSTAIVRAVKGRSMRIHYVGWGAKWEEILPVDSPRIVEVLGPLAPPQGARPKQAVHAPFPLTGRAGVVWKLDDDPHTIGGGFASSVSLSSKQPQLWRPESIRGQLHAPTPGQHDDVQVGRRYVLVRVVNSDLGLVVFAWVALLGLEKLPASTSTAVNRRHALLLNFSALVRKAVTLQHAYLRESARQLLVSGLFRKEPARNAPLVRLLSKPQVLRVSDMAAFLPSVSGDVDTLRTILKRSSSAPRLFVLETICKSVLVDVSGREVVDRARFGAIVADLARLLRNSLKQAHTLVKSVRREVRLVGVGQRRCIHLQQVDSDVLMIAFARESWSPACTLEFYADVGMTQLVASFPASRRPPVPFAAPNPVFVVAKMASSSSAPAPGIACSILATPLTHVSIETCGFAVELLARLKSMLLTYRVRSASLEPASGLGSAVDDALLESALSLGELVRLHYTLVGAPSNVVSMLLHVQSHVYVALGQPAPDLVSSVSPDGELRFEASCTEVLGKVERACEDMGRWVDSVVRECVTRYTTLEDTGYFSVYLRGLLEFVVSAMRLQQYRASARVEAKTPPLVAIVEAQLPVVSAMYALVHQAEVRGAFEGETEEAGRRFSPECWERRGCACRLCLTASKERLLHDEAVSLLDLTPNSIWFAVLDYARACYWAVEEAEQREFALLPVRESLAPVLIPDRSTRVRLFDALLNVTATSDRSLPEISFTRPSHVGNGVVKVQPAAGEFDMFDQLVHSFASVPLHRLRGAVGKVVWHTRFRGAVHGGAAGLPGPFRQSLGEICAALVADARTSSESSLLIQCPNGVHQAGEDRDALVVNPACRSAEQLRAYYTFGQLLGVAIRSKSCLDLDLAASFWHALVYGWESLLADELSGRVAWLSTFDFNAWTFVQFASMTRQEFESVELHYTTYLSDGHMQVELVPGGERRRVRFEDRHVYAQLVLCARFRESEVQMHHIREGLCSIVFCRANSMWNALALLTPEELQLRVCGEATVDLRVLYQHTVYQPRSINAHSRVIRDFWTVLNELSHHERGLFLQFAWARSRLPSDLADRGKPVHLKSYRMLVTVMDTLGDEVLPTSETCFFNIKLPHYSSIEVMRARLRLAIQCRSITF